MISLLLLLINAALSFGYILSKQRSPFAFNNTVDVFADSTSLLVLTDTSLMMFDITTFNAASTIAVPCTSGSKV
jgi:hypothetical protein